jgi:nicotinamide-nucleotide amidase
METIDTLTQRIVQTLNERQWHITFAESCTGGRLAAAFTAISGVSAVFDGAVVSYANRIKTGWLGVKPVTLERHGAVSHECVREMLDGILEMAGADCAIAVSGIAGPTGGTPDKPVGTVYIGIRTPRNEEIFHCLFTGDRISVQEQSVRFAIEKFDAMLKS